MSNGTASALAMQLESRSKIHKTAISLSHFNSEANFNYDMLVPFTDGSEVGFNLGLRELLEFATVCIAHHSDLQKQRLTLAKPTSP